MSVRKPRPEPEGAQRREDVSTRRAVATQMAVNYGTTDTSTNREEDELCGEGFPTSFTKGLRHDEYGLLANAEDYDQFVAQINQARAGDFEAIPKGLGTASDDPKPRTCRKLKAEEAEREAIEWRGWESPRTGHYTTLQGPDADAVGMPPAPKLGSEELTAEMAEVYALALLRDVPFHCIADGSGKDDKTGIKTQDILDALANLGWFAKTEPNENKETDTLQEKRRRLARREAHGPGVDINEPVLEPFDTSRAFRGSGPGSHNGPYVSQFMLIGNQVTCECSSDVQSWKAYVGDYIASGAKDVSAPLTNATIDFGVQGIGQKGGTFPKYCDYMLHWNAYLDVQNGANFGSDNQLNRDNDRFVATPRHLAAYVRYDALYQAYLNACLFMLGELGTPGNTNFGTRFGFQQPVRRGGVKSEGPGFPDRSPEDARQGFAAFGGPHVLSLVTEVATHCLKAVRRQKFSYHRRARPERLGALLALFSAQRDGALNGQSPLGPLSSAHLKSMHTQLGPMLKLVEQHNRSRIESGHADQHLDAEPKDGETHGSLEQPSWLKDHNVLLPMAFAEGSPMHPSYGAGHATVAGGCVTMLKAFFHTVDTDEHGNPSSVPWPDFPVMRANDDGTCLVHAGKHEGMTVSGELNKLAANISIGRNMAGVHYYTDYYESLRMGERVATGILVEQMMQYDEPMEMNFESFDGDHVHLLKQDRSNTAPVILITDSMGRAVQPIDWWTRHIDSGSVSGSGAAPGARGSTLQHAGTGKESESALPA